MTTMRTRKSTKISYKFEKIRVQVESEHLLSKSLGGFEKEEKACGFKRVHGIERYTYIAAK